MLDHEIIPLELRNGGNILLNNEKYQFWKKKYTSFKSSELNANQWCNKNKISSSTFSKWKKIFDAESKTNDDWATLSVESKVTSVPNTTVRVSVGKASIDYDENTCSHTFSKVIEVLMKYV